MKKDYKFNVKFDENDLRSYLLYLTSFNKSGKWQLILLALAFPALSLLLIVYSGFNVYLAVSLVVVSVFWVIFVVPLLYRKLSERKVEKMLKGDYNFGFKDTELKFQMDKFSIDNYQYRYGLLSKLTVFETLIIFTLAEEKDFVLPLRYLGEDYQVFIEDIEKNILKGKEE